MKKQQQKKKREVIKEQNYNHLKIVQYLHQI